MDIKKRLGWKRDRADTRDHRYLAAFTRLPSFLPEVDLRRFVPEIEDQGDLGSCVAHAITMALRWHIRRSGAVDRELSRLMLYYYGRVIENCVNEDSGLEIRDGIKAVTKYGVCDEKLWPYDVSKFKVEPPKDCQRLGKMWDNLTYERVRTQNAYIKSALSEGFPVVFGVMLYESFDSDSVARTGKIPMPDPEREAELGGHCMLLLGYKNGRYIVQNSWSNKWGDRGYCYIPETYVSSSRLGAGDYWVIKNLVE